MTRSAEDLFDEIVADHEPGHFDDTASLLRLFCEKSIESGRLTDQLPKLDLLDPAYGEIQERLLVLISEIGDLGDLLQLWPGDDGKPRLN
jgi:hypothetical protein